MSSREFASAATMVARDGRAFALGRAFEVQADHHTDQFSHFKPGTRENSVVSLVTKVAPKANA